MRRALLILAACTGSSTTPKSTIPPGYTVLDLSSTFDAVTGAELKTDITENPFYIAMDHVTVFDHTGSHYDTPSHMIRGGRTAEQVAVEKLVGRAKYLDLSGKPGPVTRAEVEGKVGKDDFVIAYVGCKPDQETPPCRFLGKDAAEYLATLPVRAFGTDMWSLSNTARFPEFHEAKKAGTPGRVEDWAPEHQALLSRDIPVFEGLENLTSLAQAGYALIVALPLKIKGANGSPARVIAIVPH